MNDWDFQEYFDVLAAPCHATHYDARIACLEGDPDLAVACLARVDAELEACLGQAESDAKLAEGAYYADCQATHGPVVAKAQAAATALLPGVQAAMLEHHQCVARKLAASRRYNEMAGLAALTLSYTVWSAQWDEDIPVGDEVLLAQTPPGAMSSPPWANSKTAGISAGRFPRLTCSSMPPWRRAPRPGSRPGAPAPCWRLWAMNYRSRWTPAPSRVASGRCIPSTPSTVPLARRISTAPPRRGSPD